MWIRSQDKKQIIKCNSFSIKEVDMTIDEFIPMSKRKELEKHKKEYVIKANTIVTLGYYSTEEKALKVLDMIEKHLIRMYTGISTYLGHPFQMPQDSEVLENAS